MNARDAALVEAQSSLIRAAMAWRYCTTNAPAPGVRQDGPQWATMLNATEALVAAVDNLVKLINPDEIRPPPAPTPIRKAA